MVSKSFIVEEVDIIAVSSGFKVSFEMFRVLDTCS